MKLTVNGQERDMPAGTTVAQLLESLGLDPRMLAVECNLELIPRAEHSQTKLTEGDSVEVVTLVGGG